MTLPIDQHTPSKFELAHRLLHTEFPAEQRFTNRELSWLDFNDRVMEEALDPTVPILERLKFLAIFASNLDEFFQVRVAFVRRQIEAGLTRKGPDGLQANDVMEKIAELVHQAHERIGECYRNAILPGLKAEGITIVNELDAMEEQKTYAVRFFESSLRNLITPLTLDASHPFPQLENGAIYFCIELKSGKRKTRLVLLRIPSNVVGRFVRVPSPEGTAVVMMIDDVIRLSLKEIFPGDEILGCYEVKILRDSELDIDDVGSPDLLKAIAEGLQRRKKAPATRFLYDPAMPAHILESFAKHLKLPRRHMFPGARYHSFSDLIQLPNVVEKQALLYEPMPPLNTEELETAPEIVDVVRRKDVLFHHPYQSFSYVVRFLEEAANDPETVAIKSTLYRVSPESRVAAALARAARHGKQVTVVVELKARFDEERNIGWARALEEAGAHVIYGLKKMKVHCKMTLLVRKEDGVMKRYCHLSTGNYNDRTARVYADLGLLTSHEGITEDVASVFNRLTGGTAQKNFHQLLVSPEAMREGFVARIRREAENARAGKPAGITAKMNSLVDPGMIDELYLASRAGVPVKLIVRGICCLRPGVAGLSDNIEVTSIVDRFLEHARIYRFENGGDPEIFLSSADWMPRNLNNRVEVAFPLLDPDVKAAVSEVLDLQLRDNVKARILHPNGTNHRRGGQPPLRSQWAMYEMGKRWAR